MRIGLVSLIALAMGASVLAEPPTGSRLGNRFVGGIKFSEEDADAAATKMASCLVNKREPSARTYMDAYTAEGSDKVRNVLFQEVSCLSFGGMPGVSDTIQVTFPREVLRGKMAEALLKGKSTAIAALPALPLAKDYSRPWFAATGRNPVIDEMGACVVDTNPKAAAGVIATDAYSKEEAAAFGAVMPSLGVCLRAGAKLQANRQGLRAALADALYQRLTRPPLEAQIAAAKEAARQGRTQYKKFAECVVGKYSRDARSYVVEDLSEQETTRLREKMLDGECWRASTGMQPPIATTGLKLQGMLAEVMLANEPGRGTLLDVKNIAPLNHQPVNAEERRKADPELLKFMDAMYYVFRAGECVVRADVTGADRLLKSGLASAEETEAVAALKPAFEGCPKWDSSYSPSIDELRATIAANYYRLGHPRNAAVGGAGGAK
jgi:hypothetical protein